MAKKRKTTLKASAGRKAATNSPASRTSTAAKASAAAKTAAKRSASRAGTTKVKKTASPAHVAREAASVADVPADGLNWLTVVGAAHNNLRAIDVRFPLGRFVCVTGVSGSGKSSLVNDILHAQLARDLNGAENPQPGRHERIDGLEHLDKVIDIDQTPIGRTPRSNPATYIKVFDEIRSLYARSPDAKVRGYKPGRFSFNVPTGAKGGGRCEACEGNGATKMEMDFLADVWVTCPVCGGKRFNRETLQILFKGKNIFDVLDMDVQQALEHFGNIPKIAGMLQTLHDVGLDYIKLGQSSTTLSGGEAQRIKLARELVKRSTGRTLYLLDEPTTGLHFDDIKRLLSVLHGFVDAGNTVVVIEHNTDVIKTADWIIDLGPEGGAGGGTIVAEGTPEELARVAASHTGRVLEQVLNGHAAPTKGANGRRARRRSRANDRIKEITVVGARQHNLKDITVAIPREQTTIVSGLSGSGKSSLAIDTVYAEGQRRYVESLSAYARQFLGQLQKPKVEHVTGLSPAISIEQKAASRSPRSTVGTVTEIYDYMRVLWARIGVPYCPKCQVPIGTQTADEIVERVLALGDGTRALLLAPIERTGSETYDALLAREKQNGYARVRIDGVVHELTDDIRIDHRQRHTVELVVDRVVIRKSARSRIADSVEQALALGAGVMYVQVVDDGATPARAASASERAARTAASAADLRFSQLLSCASCGTSYEEISPHHLSFNTRMGWCDACEGLGVQVGASPAAIINHPTRSLLDGAVAGWGKVKSGSLLHRLIAAVADRIGFDAGRPWNELTEGQRLAFLQGGDEEWIEVPKCGGLRVRWRGFFPAIDRATRMSWHYRKKLEDLVTDVPCEACHGSRLKPAPRAVRVGERTMPEVCNLPLVDALRFFEGLKLDTRQRRIAGELLHEITARLTFLVDVGLDYLALARSAPTLSGGESQRIRLASQIGSGLTGVLYVLDEPTIGLHPRDNQRLIGALQKLRNLGNTLLIVEHDREVIASADHVLDFGPGAGDFGGKVTAAASPARLKTKRDSLTGQYLAGKRAVAIPSNRRPIDIAAAKRVPERWLTIEGAYHHNLKEVDVDIPLGRLTCITGVSGSGKSSLISDVLYPALATRIHRARLVPGGHQGLRGVELIDKVINVDQSPLGNSPTSNPATYTGVFDLVRELFARLPESKVRGYNVNRFSFNRAGGRCEACEGMGQRCIEMHFLPDVWITCEACGGKRYTAETLEVTFKGHSIADVLDMRIGEALELFKSVPKLRRMLQTLDDVGLGYLQLGQSAPTLSGGEAQRVKLAAELGRPATGKTLYILDEPTTGLHFEDLRKLLLVLHRLVDLGNAVVCIEHNLDVIKNADWVIELGPEAGHAGGHVVAACTPEELLTVPESHTGKALAPVLAAGPYEQRVAFDPDKQARIEAELEKPLQLESADVDARMPWQSDGRRWHLQTHLDHHGKQATWDTAVLSWVAGAVEKIPGFAPTNWNSPSTVEIAAPSAGTRWFLHARTRGSTQLDLSFRVPVGTFTAADLIRKLGIKPLDARDDLPIYSGAQRVHVRNAGSGWSDVRIQLHDMKDIAKTAFGSFLKKAAAAYFAAFASVKADPQTATPWKTDPRQWHLSQRSIHHRHKQIHWKPPLLPAVIGQLSKLLPGVTVDWSRKVIVGLVLNGEMVVNIVTNQPQGLRLHLRVPRASVTPTQIDRLGREPTLRSQGAHDEVVCWVRSLESLDRTQLQHVARQMAAMAVTVQEKSA
ncbi:MAG: excinuclease ABC subunit UvrA [Phycisphaerales bacterium]|nr:excinuclease ABC subunit UvrA [Phycisphaerales bacterium]